MTKLLALVYMLLILSGCSALNSSAPTALPPVTGKPTQPAPPPTERMLEPTTMSITPTIAAQASDTATPTPTAVPTPAPTASPAPAALRFTYPIGMPGQPPG